MDKKLLALLILDGFGNHPDDYGNAIHAAKTPNIDAMYQKWPTVNIGASGADVGLPDGQMGNSEVGHTNIGAGRIVYQELTRITKSIQSNDFYKNEAFLNAMENCKKNHTALHLIGLLSNGGVHSHNQHLFALLKLAKEYHLKKVYIHAFLDGRDVSPTSGITFIKECIEKTAQLGVGTIATVMGRYYAMDRDNRWERIQKAYEAMVYGKGVKAENAVQAIEQSYQQNITDEFVLPTVCAENATINANDSVIFYNFRPDRAREITRSLVDPDFQGFTREKGNSPIHFVCMTQYDKTMPNVEVAFKPETLANTFGEYISKKGLTQLRIAETEKYAHVTFFFNGGIEKKYDGEDRILIPSPSVATYDLQPEMSAPKVTEEVLKCIESKKYDVIILNFANCDMVGHTGVFNAAVQAVETVDECLGKILAAIENQDGIALVTADHGNADKMYNEDGSPFTAHTTNPVPFTVVGKMCQLREDGRLADIAPTMLSLLNLPKPSEMTGESLIIS